MATSFVAVPLTLGYLGIERYGFLVSLTSLMAVFSFADLGLGNGTLNVVSEAEGRQDRDLAAAAVSSAFFMMLSVATLVALATAAILLLVPWSGLVPNVDPSLRSDVVAGAAVLCATTIASIPLGLVERVRMGLQEGYVSSRIALLGSVIGLAVLLIAIWARVSMPSLIAIIALPPVAVLVANGVDLFGRRRWLTPRLALARRGIAVRLLRVGFLFLVLQVAMAVAYQSDVIVAGLVLGPSASATYALSLKLFFVIPSFISLYLVTLWPAYSEALARGDHHWVRLTLRRSVLLAGVASTVSSVFLVLTGALIIRVWTGGVVSAPTELLIGMGLWAVTYSVFNALSILMNAANVILFQVAAAVVMALASITLSFALANRLGLSGVIWGTLIAYLVFSALPIVIYLSQGLARIAPPHSAEPVGE